MAVRTDSLPNTSHNGSTTDAETLDRRPEGRTQGGLRVPFYSQKVNWRGEDSGFPNPDEVERWQSNCCGIACARMVIETLSSHRVGYWDLLQEGLQSRAYNDVGWIHRGLVELVARRGIHGSAHRTQDFENLLRSCQEGNLCIASVTVGFWGGQAKPGTDQVFGRGGHLVVAFVNHEGRLSCHHPSSRDEGNRADWVVSEEAWRRSFSGGFMEFTSEAALRSGKK